jgi:hypothetical protein
MALLLRNQRYAARKSCMRLVTSFGTTGDPFAPFVMAKKPDSTATDATAAQQNPRRAEGDAVAAPVTWVIGKVVVKVLH